MSSINSMEDSHGLTIFSRPSLSETLSPTEGQRNSVVFGFRILVHCNYIHILVFSVV